MPPHRNRPKWTASVAPETPDRIAYLVANIPGVRSKGAAVDLAVKLLAERVERRKAEVPTLDPNDLIA